VVHHPFPRWSVRFHISRLYDSSTNPSSFLGFCPNVLLSDLLGLFYSSFFLQNIPFDSFWFLHIMARHQFRCIFVCGCGPNSISHELTYLLPVFYQLSDEKLFQWGR
jgi:hypothetical protein